MSELQDRRFYFDCPHCGETAAREVTRFGDQDFKFLCEYCKIRWSEPASRAGVEWKVS